jgi:PleD family two-component response regulator
LKRQLLKDLKGAFMQGQWTGTEQRGLTDRRKSNDRRFGDIRTKAVLWDSAARTGQDAATHLNNSLARDFRIQSEEATATPKQKTILVADDERDIADALRAILQKSGYQVIVAGSGREALAFAATHRPDLVVLDAMMPEMNGLETLKQFKMNRQTAHIPVVILTSLYNDEVVSRFWHMGSDLVLPKPFHTLQLTGFLDMAFATR